MAESIMTGVFLLFCSYTDIKQKEINTGVAAVFGLAGIMLCVSVGTEAVLSALTGMIPGVFILFISKATKGAIGEGDGLMLMVTGLYLGLIMNLRLFVLALLLSAVIAVAALIAKICDRKTELPFAPFLLVSFILFSVTKG